jgi:NhaP-type Na+/H+ or K+/H+ antiporter
MRDRLPVRHAASGARRWLGSNPGGENVDQWALPTIAVLLLGYGAVSGRLQSTVVTQAMVFVALGLLVGNRVLDLVEVDAANQYVRLLAEATLALVLFTDAVRVKLGSLRREAQGLNVESGLNDGVCVPLLIIFLTLAQAEEGGGRIEPFRVVLEEIGFGTIGGVLAGALGALVLRRFAARGWMEGTWQQINAVATPLLAYTVAAGLGGSGFIGAFVAGIVFGAVAGERAEHSTFLAEQSGELLNAVTFLLFGAVLLGPALGELDWRVALYAVGSLTVVRMLPVALAMLGTGMRRVTVGFLGWFGPRGLASIVFVLLLVEETQLPERSLMLTVVTWTVALSVYAHGLSAWPGANRYADWYAAHRRDHGSMPESVPATEQRVRVPAAPRQGEGPT